MQSWLNDRQRDTCDAEPANYGSGVGFGTKIGDGLDGVISLEKCRVRETI